MRMDPSRRRRLIEDMLRYTSAIDGVSRRGRTESFDQGEFLKRATSERDLELLGEASGAVGKALRSRNPNIPWSALSRIRFDSAHRYDDAAKPVNYEEVWRFVTKDLPRIERRLRAVSVLGNDE